MDRQLLNPSRKTGEQIVDDEQGQDTAMYLLSIRGTLAPPTLDAARAIHNETAGAPASVAAARSLGDLSHMVYVPTHGASAGAGEVLFLDLWNSLTGLNQFFADPQVQQGAGRIFSDRDPVVWAPAEGFLSYNLPAPHGSDERLVSIARGLVSSRAAAQSQHNALIAGGINKARAAGNLSHAAYFRLAAPDSSDTLEFFAMDVWMNAQGMQQHYADPAFQGAFYHLFATPPSTSAWVHPQGAWMEW